MSHALYGSSVYAYALNAVIWSNMQQNKVQILPGTATNISFPLWATYCFSGSSGFFSEGNPTTMHSTLLSVGEVEREECKHERVTKTVSMTTTGDSLPSFLESQSIPNVLSDYPITVNLLWLLLASFPGFPFFVFWFAFRIKKQRNTEKWGRPWNTYMYYMNDIRCWWGWRRGGEGVHIQQHIRHHHQALCC